MSYVELLHRLSFNIDPFAKTNADEEELLKSYFIEPPFFKAFYGDLSTPKSAVVFAPPRRRQDLTQTHARDF
jgi:hypothetical protein